MDAVVSNGEDKWYEIGLELHLNDAKVHAVAADKPVAAGKLRAVIEKRRSATGRRTLVKELLLACKALGIFGAVCDELRESGNR